MKTDRWSKREGKRVHLGMEGGEGRRGVKEREGGREGGRERGKERMKEEMRGKKRGKGEWRVIGGCNHQL